MDFRAVSPLEIKCFFGTCREGRDTGASAQAMAPKKAAASGAGRGRGASKGSAEFQSGAYVLKHYSRGLRRRQVEDCAAAFFNREIVMKHSQNNWKRICEEEGFHLHRYRRGLLIEPPENDPLVHSRHTNKCVACYPGRLAPVRDAALPGVFGKTHLWHAFYSAKKGGCTYHDSGLPMILNTGDETMMEHADEGMWFELIEWRAYVEHPQAVCQLMEDDNYDACYALACTEIALHHSYFRSCRLPLPENTTQWEHVQALAKNHGNFQDDFKLATFNFVKVIGEEQMAMISDAYHAYVDASAQSIPVPMLVSLTLLPATTAWFKACIYIANMCLGTL